MDTPKSSNERSPHGGPCVLCLVCPHLSDGGVQRVVSTLANAWSAHGRSVAVVTIYRDALHYPLDPDVRLISLPDGKGWGRLLGALESLRLALERRGQRRKHQPASAPTPPSSHARMSRWLWRLHLPVVLRIRALRRAIRSTGAPQVLAFCGSTNVQAILACASLPVHLIISERNDPSRKPLKFPWEALRRACYNDADVVTANNQGALDTLSAWVDRGRLALVSNPFDFANLPTTPAERVRSPNTLLVVGRLHPQKAISILLEAMARLPADLDHWRLTIVGRGPLESQRRRQAEDLGIAGRTDWKGQVDNPGPYYAGSSVFVMPSVTEGSLNALIEALSFGMPVIVSDASPGPLELVEDGKSGLVFPAGDAGALARTIEELARSETRRAAMGAAARATASRHEVEAVLNRWESLFAQRPDPGV